MRGNYLENIRREVVLNPHNPSRRRIIRCYAIALHGAQINRRRFVSGFKFSTVFGNEGGN